MKPLRENWLGRLEGLVMSDLPIQKSEIRFIQKSAERKTAWELFYRIERQLQM